MRILVTGGNTGIGFALSKQLAMEHNCHVYLAARDHTKGQNAVSQIQSLIERNKSEGSVQYIAMDVSNDESVKSAANSISDQLLGTGEKLYGLVNNAGVGLNTALSPSELLNTNLYGPKRVCEAFLPLIDGEKGRIVNLGK